MKNNFAETIMNPVRQRIVQYLLLHENATVGELAKELSDVPRPSLYRHVRILLEAGFIEIVGEKAVRGAVEKTYCLTRAPMGDPSGDEIAALIQSMLLSLAASFARYFALDGADPQRDLLSVSSSTLMLSDAEFMEMLEKIGGVYKDYLNNKPRGDRKPRCVTFVSSPAENGGK